MTSVPFNNPPSGAGLSRSPSILAAYMMKTMKLGYQEAINRITSARPYVYPNEG
jgi:protein-tyrosine phosphatase